MGLQARAEGLNLLGSTGPTRATPKRTRWYALRAIPEIPKRRQTNLSRVLCDQLCFLSESWRRRFRAISLKISETSCSGELTTMG